MSKAIDGGGHAAGENEPLPLVAPCRQLDAGAPFRWLALGWADIRRAPGPSLTYGVIMVLISYLISLVAWELGSLALFVALLSGYVLVGPVLALGLYSISCQLQIGRRPQLGYCLREGRRHIGNELIFGVILLIVFLIWARAASMIHVFFPMEAEPSAQELIIFLSVGSLVGSMFAAIIFAASAFSLPMIMDRKVDMVTAVVTSINAVLRNKMVMALWAGLIVLSVLLGFLTAFLGMVVLLPLIGHATWHAYRDTILPDAWAEHNKQ